MKSAVSIAVVMALMMQILTDLAAAQEQRPEISSQPGPIVRVITGETNWYVAAAAPTMSNVNRFELPSSPGQRRRRESPPPLSDWSHVTGINRGDDILLTTHGSQPLRRFLVRADDAELVVLDLSNDAITEEASGLLIEAVAETPECFERARDGETCRPGMGLRLGADGLFVADRKIAELRQILQTVPRHEVAEVSLMTIPLAPHMWGGAALGALVGGLVWLAVSNGRNSGEVRAIGPLGLLFGVAAGSGFGAIGASRARGSPRWSTARWIRRCGIDSPGQVGPRELSVAGRAIVESGFSRIHAAPAKAGAHVLTAPIRKVL